MQYRIPDDTLIDEFRADSRASLLNRWPYNEFAQLNAEGIDGEGIVVGVSDTGLTNHPAFKYAKIQSTKNYISGGSNVTDDNSHGTHVASLIAGWEYGPAPKATLRINKVLNARGSGGSDGISQAVVDSAKDGCDFVNASLGSNPGSELATDRQAIKDAYNAGLSLYVCAAGNAGYNGANTIGPPGSYDDVWTVGAIGKDGKVANFSSGGKTIDSACPGHQIPGASYKGTGEIVMSGTSMACPIQTGILCLIQQRRLQVGLPKLIGYSQWLEFFKTSGFLKDEGTPGFDPRYGYGVPMIQEIIKWLKNPVGFILMFSLWATAAIAQDAVIQTVPSDEIVYLEAKSAEVYENESGVIILAKGLGAQQKRGVRIKIEAGSPYLIFATDQNKVGFNPINLTQLEKDLWLLLGESGQKFKVIVIRTNKDGNQEMSVKDVVIEGTPTPPVDPPNNGKPPTDPNLKAWYDLAYKNALTINDKPTAKALGEGYIAAAATLSTVDLNEAYKKVQAVRSDILAKRVGESQKKNWNSLLLLLESELTKAKITDVKVYAQIVNQVGYALLDAAK